MSKLVGWLFKRNKLGMWGLVLSYAWQHREEIKKGVSSLSRKMKDTTSPKKEEVEESNDQKSNEKSNDRKSQGNSSYRSYSAI